MLTKLTPDQVAEYWDDLKEAIGNALPPVAGGNEEVLNYVLARLLAEHMQCWVSRRDGKIYGIGTTTVFEDPCSGSKDLLLYTVYAMPGADKELWVEAYETVKKWAVAQGCSRFVGYTTNPEMVKVLEKFGAEFWTYAAVPFDQNLIKEEG